jgi:hypothetical protein
MLASLTWLWFMNLSLDGNMHKLMMQCPYLFYQP